MCLPGGSTGGSFRDGERQVIPVEGQARRFRSRPLLRFPQASLLGAETLGEMIVISAEDQSDATFRCVSYPLDQPE
jgi:hypothetical protein